MHLVSNERNECSNVQPLYNYNYDLVLMSPTYRFKGVDY